MSKEKILEVKDLAISFRTQQGVLQAVRGINFELYKGETLAIVGESGSGKSVTSRAIIGILAGNSIHAGGSIYYYNSGLKKFKQEHVEDSQGQEEEDVIDLMKIDEEDFHKLRGTKISMIFQDPMSSLNPIMKVGKQISEALYLKLGLTKEQAKERAIELMREVGIPEPEKRYYSYPFQFSGGMRQRIVIAIALANDAEILICDEPTTALDVTIQAQILELINRIKKERNLSIIFITHDLGVVANMSDRIGVMYAGKIVEYGTVNEVFYQPKHPYTWALLSAMPDLDSKDKLFAIPGTPPDMHFPPKGDAFAARNKYAMKIDFEEQPPMFKVSDTHFAATWLLHPDAPKMDMPEGLKARIERNKALTKEEV
ncbi:Oligopeptide ABC transporter, ATPase component [Paracholeplasma brassicae]|uniref:Oligopeptide ABC transporter, ATPase component n=1 Tax=Acholeplasma brassicae TaxID=61635 RepID=U4KPV9_9MOLU|nr:ABC transporter ATP-binding protein [Paracholeplasma brassicae]CCV66415.1 Oligopeptide ABC transporter, ATPase component [Paracholeplasma brassicae]